jgi:hypothetical protein
MFGFKKKEAKKEAQPVAQPTVKVEVREVIRYVKEPISKAEKMLLIRKGWQIALDHGWTNPNFATFTFEEAYRCHEVLDLKRR